MREEGSALLRFILVDEKIRWKKVTAVSLRSAKNEPSLLIAVLSS